MVSGFFVKTSVGSMLLQFGQTSRSRLFAVGCSTGYEGTSLSELHCLCVGEEGKAKGLGKLALQTAVEKSHRFAGNRVTWTFFTVIKILFTV